MQHGINIPNWGEFSDPRAMAELAREAEQAGWDGIFIWDHIQLWMGGGTPMADPWVTLAAMSVATERIRLGTMITPVARRRPWKLARETVTLDHLSGGRLVLGVGLGTPADAEYESFGEDPDARVRARKLDEGLEILDGLWSGEPFSYQGKHYRVQETTFVPRPIQSPRIPIWVAGIWPHKPPFRRAARWDGICLDLNERMTPYEVGEAISFTEQNRTSTGHFEVIYGGPLPDDEAARSLLQPFATAGVTWWVQGITWEDRSHATLLKVVRRGPPER